MKQHYETSIVIRTGGIGGVKTNGIQRDSQKGSHVKMKHPDGRKIVFPYHDEVDRYTLKGALKDAEIDMKEFLKNL